MVKHEKKTSKLNYGKQVPRKRARKPDKTGKRMQLEIGLCECCGKTFRTVLSKQKI